MRGLVELKKPEEELLAEGQELWASSSSSSESGMSPISTMRASRVVLSKRMWELIQNFGLADLQEMNLMAVLSAWHCIGLWLSGCILFCEVLQKLLKGYVMWMELVMNQDGSVQTHVKIYLAVLMRCWFVVLFYADLARFCYWLARDAWRPDAFEAYRRAVLGLGEAEMRSGMLHYDVHGMPRGWPEEGLTCRQRVADTCMQVFIFFTFDVYPIVMALGDAQFWGSSLNMLSMLSAMTSHAGAAGLLHCAIFKFAWLCTDLHMKYHGLKKALKQGGFRGFREPEEGDGSASSSEEETEAPMALSENPDLAAAALIGEVKEYDLAAPSPGARARNYSGMSSADRVLTEHEADVLEARLKVATELNLCVHLCKWLRVVVPYLFYLGLLASGIYTGRWLLVLVALSCTLYQVGVGCMYLFRVAGSVPTADKVFPCLRTKRRQRLAWSLQAWGEECCGLEYDVQLERRTIFSIMVGLQIALFASLGWGDYTAVCVFLVILQLQQLTVYCQIPWGWLWSLVEAALYFLCITILSFDHLKKKQAIETIVFMLGHQIGLARKTYYGVLGYKVVRLVITLLFVVLFIVLAVTMLSVDSLMDKNTKNASMLQNATTYYTVPYISQKFATGLACPSWFHLGNRRLKLSLSDFGLLSAIAYEDAETLPITLGHFFPGWTLAYSKRVDNETIHDWTTFFEIQSPANETTIFIVRGTSTALDALNDMIIWMPAAVMQVFSLLGPDMLAPVAQAIGWLSEIFGHLDTQNYEMLERHVISTMKRDPLREYYITGHSLGGGLAKIVALKALVEDLELPAVTFMSPGLLSTQYLVESRVWKHELREEITAAYLRDHAEVVTVMPENDIVSRIDTQTGQVVPIGCASGSPLACHLIGQGLCEIFQECGSGRHQEEISLPCGLCPKLKCEEGVPVKEFPTKMDIQGMKEEGFYKKHPF